MIKKFCVLIPSYNEARTIGAIIKEVKDRGLTIYVVDDGSIDDTALVAEAGGAMVIRHKANIGKGASLKDGFERILKDGFDAALVMDGDGQHKVEDIDHFLKKMEETDADMVIGNRLLDTAPMPYVRILTNRFMSNLISKISKQYIPDSQCGYRLIKKDVLQRLTLESSNYEIESEMIVKAARAGFKIDSVPVKTVYQDEASRINPVLDTLRFVRLMVKFSFRR